MSHFLQLVLRTKIPCELYTNVLSYLSVEDKIEFNMYDPQKDKVHPAVGMLHAINGGHFHLLVSFEQQYNPPVRKLKWYEDARKIEPLPQKILDLTIKYIYNGFNGSICYDYDIMAMFLCLATIKGNIDICFYLVKKCPSLSIAYKYSFGLIRELYNEVEKGDIDKSDINALNYFKSGYRKSKYSTHYLHP